MSDTQALRERRDAIARHIYALLESRPEWLPRDRRSYDKSMRALAALDRELDRQGQLEQPGTHGMREPDAVRALRPAVLREFLRTHCRFF